MQTLVTISQGVFPVCAKLRIKNVYSAFFPGSSKRPYSWDPGTDFHAKYVKRLGSTQGCGFSG